MASTTIKKNAKGYGYTYTDLAQIHEQLEALGWRYYQYIETEDGTDYIYTVLTIDGKDSAPRRGCKVIETAPSGKTNPAQAYGSGLTYARRYSLLMACGFATSDDDAQTLDGTTKKTVASRTQEEKQKAKPKAEAQTKTEQRIKSEELAKSLADEIGKDIDNLLASWGKPRLTDISDADLMKTLDWLDAKKSAKA